MRHISSRENPAWKSLLRLCHSSRERRKQNRCVLEGVHTTRAYVERFGPPEQLIVDEGALSDVEIRKLVGTAPPATVIVAASPLFEDLAQTATPAGLIAVAAVPRPSTPMPRTFGLLLEDVQDPGNVGTILRVAAAGGASHVFLTPGCAFAWSPKVLRSAQGAHFHLDIIENADVGRVAAAFAGSVVAAVPHAEASLFDAYLRGPLLILIGNEGAGLSDAAVGAARLSVRIPMPGGFESLNAATAAAICVFEKVRQDAAGRD